MLSFTINKNDSGQRADKFLLKATSAPASLIYKTFRKKDVKIDKKPIKESFILDEGQLLTVYISDEFAKKAVSAQGASCDIEIVYEDENIAVMNKPKGLPSQPDKNHSDALSGRFKAYLEEKGEYNPLTERSFSPALCNRLDVNTSGLVIGAKNAPALREMNAAIRERLVEKYYICRCKGVPNPPSATVNSTISKDGRANKSTVGAGGKEISTSYRVLSVRGDTSLVEIQLHTGRSHQIRAQMAALGCPLIGDAKYGGERGKDGQELTAYKLIFKTSAGMFEYLNGKEISLKGGNTP